MATSFQTQSESIPNITPATNNAEVNTALRRFIAHVNCLKEEVQQNCIALHQLVDEQQTSLITQLDEILSAVQADTHARRDKLKQLRVIQENLEANLVQNELNKVLEGTLRTFKVEMSKLEMQTLTLPYLELHWKQTKVEQFVREMCIIEKKQMPLYKDRTHPIWANVSSGSEEHQLIFPYGLCIDDANGQIYVADFDGNRIQVFTRRGEYVRSIKGENLEQPMTIKLTSQYCYVTCNQENTTRLLKLNKSTGAVLAITDRNEKRTGIDLDEEDNLYCCLVNDNKVIVFNSNLQQIDAIVLNTLHHKSGNTEISDLHLLHIEIIILFTNCKYPLQSFNRRGEFIRTILTDAQVDFGLFFCIDLLNNFIVSDSISHSIRIFSYSGENILVIGKEGNELDCSFGVCIDLNNSIIVCDNKSNNMLQSF